MHRSAAPVKAAVFARPASVAPGSASRRVPQEPELADSASALRLTERLHIEPLVDALHLLLKTNEMTEARLRSHRSSA